ncbi:MAG: PHP domain-containing protein [Candidatus Omnitrophota bacterium]|nr:MAG: PHP domain-containing protein [Candidatus Omnitrophota bacterium]
MENTHRPCDLHIHSVFSDSDTPVEEILKVADAKNLSCIAIADHDTVGAMNQARILSRQYHIEFIEAIELSAQEKDCEIHVLGYFIDPLNKKLNDALGGIRELREARLIAMADKLISLGVGVDKEELMARTKDAIPTRLHLALYLVEIGRVRSLWDAFRKYLSPGKPAYVARFKHTAREAIELIKDSGGLAFLAHPYFLADQSWIEKFVSFGLDGIEVNYPRFSPSRIAIYENMADKYGLLKSGGSDAHGSYKEFTEIGGVTVPYEWVEAMKARLSPPSYTDSSQ